MEKTTGDTTQMDLLNQFSEKEKAVIHLLLQGKSNKQIAFTLGVTVRTVEFHLGNIYEKIGVNSRSEAILRLTRNVSNADNYPGGTKLREPTVALSSVIVDNEKKLLSTQSPHMHMMKLAFI